MTLKCWLCANTGKRVGKGMAWHKLQPQPTARHVPLWLLRRWDAALPTILLPTLAQPITVPWIFPCSHPQDTTDILLWCHATQTHDQIFNRSLGRKGQGMIEPWDALWSYAPEMTKNEKARQPLAHGEHNHARCLVQDKHLDVWLYVLFFLQMLDYCKHLG